MCGIIGRVTKDLEASIEKSIHVLLHRGPDAQGYKKFVFSGKNVEFGHTRLSILDLSSSGSQPMLSKDKRWLITYNGEIYNHNIIRQRLGVIFAGHSDTETLVEAVSALGISNTLPLLNGMFAFSLFDNVEGKIFLVRDPFGIKPIYYLHSHEGFFFSSEIRGIMAIWKKKKSVDFNAVQTFLTLRYIPSPDTFFEDIKRLPPGFVLSYDICNDRITISNYVQPISEGFSGNIDDAINIYTETLQTAVKNQLLSDVPVGVLLSGGIDSSLIAAMAAKIDPDLPCFTVGFGNDYKDCEIKDASQTADILGLKHHFITVGPEDLWSVFKDVISSVEEPLGTTSILPMWYLVQKAREHVTVVLAGQGNDEPWGGYRKYQAELWQNFLPYPELFKLITSLMNPFLHQAPDFVERALRTLGTKELSDRLEANYTLFTETERLSLTGRNDSGNSLESICFWLNWVGDSKKKTVEKMMQIDTRMNLADDLLLYGDKISMAFSLETRVPMLDIDLVRLVESFPVNYKVGFGKTKIVHKLAAQKFLPKEIVKRPKKGFQVPFSQWAKGIWRDNIESVLFESDAPFLDILDVRGVGKIWNEHLRGEKDRTRQLFALLSFALALKK